VLRGKPIVSWFVFGFVATSLHLRWSVRQGELVPQVILSAVEDEVRTARIPIGYMDSFEEGERAASRDIKKNEMKFAVYGLIVGSLEDQYAKFNVTPVLRGCVIHRSGWEFWRGYNATIMLEMTKRGIELPDNRIWRIS